MKGPGRPQMWLMDVLLWSVLIAGVLYAMSAAGQVTTSTISDTIYAANGSAASGSAVISWPAFTTAAGQSVPKGSLSVTLGANGTLSVGLAPNAGATPAGTYYTVVYHLGDGSTSREYWTIPESASALPLSAVRTSVLPSSVAMQTVTKQYVDQAIARAATGALPQDSSAYVLKSGDTMTGALTLPGDPVSGLQAATKNYVDAASSALQAGLGQKVSLVPSGTQTVTQPAGTQLQVNNLNGQLYAKQYQSQTGNDGITNALTSSNWSSGCSDLADPTYPGRELFSYRNGRSQLIDQRGGATAEYSLNPQSPNELYSTAHSITVNGTITSQVNNAAGHGAILLNGLYLRQNALTGGNNLFPQNVTQNVPYFKSTYGTSITEGYNFTQGQHVLDGHTQNCYAIGDCLIGSQFLYSSGGYRDNADEGTHPMDLVVAEHLSVFRGTCTSGCSTGSTSLQITSTAYPGTQGEGRYLIDTAPSKLITSGTLIGAGTGGHHASVLFSGTSIPVSTFFSLASAALPQSNTLAPGTINAAIMTSGVAGGYSTNTAAAPAASGVACVADADGPGGTDDFETVNYSVSDGTHIQLTLNKPHAAGATVAIGGLCGYGIEQTVDTTNNIRQLFPVIGSSSATSLFYSGLGTRVLGAANTTSAFANIQTSLSSLQRSGNVVTATITGTFAQDINGLTVNVSGVADSSYNGTFQVTTISSNQFTYTQTGANSTSTGGSVSYLTGSYVLYPAAEVLSVYNPATQAIDGAMTLAPNTVAWASGDPVEQPHYFQSRVAADVEYVTQYEPRPIASQQAGVQYNGNNGAYLQGWYVRNNTDPSAYYGNGGTHQAPDSGMTVQGPWNSSLDLQAGETNGFIMRCNSHGCNRWNSAYNLFALQSSTYFDYINYAPTSSTLTFNMRGTQYSISPAALTAGTINATTINATRINGLQAATSTAVGGVTLGPSATAAVLANVATSGSASDLTSGTIDPARLPAGYGGTGAGGGSSVCASNVAFTATPTFAVTCSNPTFHMPLTGNVTGETFTGLSAGQVITLIFQVGSTPGFTVLWSSSVHGGFITSSVSGAAGYTQAGKYFVQQLVVDTDGATLLNPGAINE